MDARVDGVPVTPRTGKAVEVNALWINGLAGAGRAARAGRPATPTELWRLHRPGHGPRSGDRFPRPGRAGCTTWWTRPAGVPGGATTTTLRPNQLLAWSLPYAPLRAGPGGRCAGSARRCSPRSGLRSLGPGRPGYRGRTGAARPTGTRAYHQGTVWPWLIGPYVDAAAAPGCPTDDVLDGLSAHLGECGLGSVSETADGDAPHAATGCPFQAWSVAELLRVTAGSDRQTVTTPATGRLRWLSHRSAGWASTHGPSTTSIDSGVRPACARGHPKGAACHLTPT